MRGFVLSDFMPTFSVHALLLAPRGQESKACGRLQYQSTGEVYPLRPFLWVLPITLRKAAPPDQGRAKSILQSPGEEVSFWTPVWYTPADEPRWKKWVWYTYVHTHQLYEP